MDIYLRKGSCYMIGFPNWCFLTIFLVNFSVLLPFFVISLFLDIRLNFFF
jgi:hypothetical protein